MTIKTPSSDANAVVFCVSGPSDYGHEYWQYSKNLDRLYMDASSSIIEAMHLIFYYKCKLNYDAFVSDISYTVVEQSYDAIADDDYFNSIISVKDFTTARTAFCELAWLYYCEYYNLLTDRFGNIKDYYEYAEVQGGGNSYAVRLYFREVIGYSQHNSNNHKRSRRRHTFP